MNESTKVFVFKYGGNAMTNPQLQEEVLGKLKAAHNKGNQVVIVHGGGPFIEQTLQQYGVKSVFVDGHRKTDVEALKLVEMTLKGQVNAQLVSILNWLGANAVGLSGKDGNWVKAEKRRHQSMVGGQLQEIDLERVGNVQSVDPSFIELLLEKNYIPVICCIASDDNGNELNINADMFAGHIAGAIKADEFVLMTDIDGLLKDISDPTSLFSQIQLSEMEELKNSGDILGGMIPKVDSCGIALSKGAKRTRIINGTKPEQITRLLENDAVGTRIEHD